MDINLLRSLATLLLFISFIGLCFWVFSAKRKQTYEEAANLPFADDENTREEKE